MVRKIISLLLCLATILPLSSTSFAAAAAAATSATAEEKSDLTGTRKQMATIIFSGLAGAILGLSTLSFYGRPQDRLSNIAVGFALGIIVGTIASTYQVATHPYDIYEGTQFQFEKPALDEGEKRFIAMETQQYHPTLGWSWHF